MTEDDLESDGPPNKLSPSLTKSAEIIPVADTMGLSIDKINNLVQKETSLKKAGVTRYKYMLVIAEALEATKWADEPDEQGNIKRVQKPDVTRRQWGAEQAARLYGDMIERKEIEHDIGDKTLDRFRALSVAELKQRAKDILNGSPQSRLPSVIDV